MIEDGEACDDGPLNGEPCPYGARSCEICTSDCQLAQGITSFCGDGFVQEESEECDGDDLRDDGPCTAQCRLAVCGDGLVQEGIEECDDGEQNPNNHCNNDCTENGICTDTCETSNNDICEDAGHLSVDNSCEYGSDCGDCGTRRYDLCYEYPERGSCYQDVGIVSCVSVTGSGLRRTQYQACQSYETCVESESGATCELRPEYDCVPNEKHCAEDEVTLNTCTTEGTWSSEICGVECVDSSLISYCRDEDYATRSGTLYYQVVVPNEDLTDWAETDLSAHLPSVMLTSYIKEGETYKFFDITQSGLDGSYTIKTRRTPDPEDLIVIWLINYDQDGAHQFAAIRSEFEDGAHEVQEVLSSVSPSQVWRLSYYTAQVTDGISLRVTEQYGAGVIRTYDYMRYIYGASVFSFGSNGGSIALWIQPNVTWNCGACYAQFSNVAANRRFSHAIFLGHDENRNYWSDSVTAHELGHWAMGQYGTSPGEGGRHFLSVPTFPGQAWSEGFATFYSSISRGSPLYISKQNGTFFWLDLRSKAYSDGRLCSDDCESAENGACEDGGIGSSADLCVFGTDCADCGLRSSRTFVMPEAEGVGYPDPEDPLLQRLDENYIASALYRIASALGVPVFGQGAQLLLDALQAPEVNKIDQITPYGRGYVRHSWTLTDQGEYIDIDPYLLQPSPSFPDYLDALRCEAGILGEQDSADLDELIEGELWTYPYPVDQEPLCRGRE